MAVANTLVGTVTQGAADAYAEAEIVTALAGQTTLAYRLIALLFELTVMPVTPAANCDIEVALSRRTKTAMPNISDRDVIFKWVQKQAIATSGGIVLPMTADFIPLEAAEVLIVEDPLYFQIDSTATTSTLAAALKLFYERVTISQVDRLTLLQEALLD